MDKREPTTLEVQLMSVLSDLATLPFFFQGDDKGLAAAFREHVPAIKKALHQGFDDTGWLAYYRARPL